MKRSSVWAASRARHVVILIVLGLTAGTGLLGGASDAQAARAGKLIANGVLAAREGGKVRAKNGAAILVPAGTLRRPSLVTITRFRSGRYDFHIGGPWRGRVAVTLPRRSRASTILHRVGRTWVSQGSRGQRTVWVGRLSLFSWAGDKLKAAACFKTLSLKDIVNCLKAKGLAKIDGELVKWLAYIGGIDDACVQQIVASKGFVSALFNALTGACVGTAGEGTVQIGPDGQPVQPPAPTPMPTPTPEPGQPAPEPTAAPAPPARTWPETTGGAARTWTNPANAGGYEGQTIGAFQTVEVLCRLTGFQVPSGNAWWYRLAQAPWNGSYYVSADAFYNNGAKSGPLKGTPFVDEAVALC